MGNNVISDYAQKQAIRSSTPYVQLLYNVNSYPYSRSWGIKVFPRGISYMFRECLDEDGFKVIEEERLQSAVCYELGIDGKLDNAPCTWLEIARK